MKYIILFVLTTFVTTLLHSQSKAIIGMSIKDVNLIYSNTQTSFYENTTTLSLADTLYGLPGEWGFRFENNKLNWIHFSKYIDKIDKQNFEKCFFVTSKLINNYSKVFGKPDTTIIGDTTFVDPFVKHHWGYNVIEARWNNYNNMKVKIEFTFFGGKGDYHFITTINYFDKNYQYFE